jgi:thiol:disulfide interchange protein DsbD
MDSMKKIITGLLLSIFICIALPVSSLDRPLEEVTAYNTTGEIIVSPGKKFIAVIAVEIPDDSYIYANPKGKGIGKATELTIKKTDYIKSWEVRYPAGESFLAKGDTDPVNRYTKIVRFPIAFVPGDKIPSGNYSINADLSALMCTSDACLPVERTVNIEFSVKRSFETPASLKMNSLSEFLSLNKSAAVTSADIKNSVNTGSGDDSGIPESIEFTPQYPEGEITGLVKAIIFGLIAGFILNFMPCVLPVVSLKIMSFVMNAGENRRVIVTQGFLFSAGIIVSFLILAVLAAFFGHQWGTLFQDRLFLIFMTSFIFAMALSLFGVFTFNIPFMAGRAVSRTRGIYTDAFIKGIVATLLATPCSGPFLGGTLAWTLTRPPEVIFVIFLSVGAGMALPYMLLALNPSLLRFLPKPGVWMNNFEKVMGFLLMFTVVYLLGILDDSGRMGLILFLLFLSLGLWQFGTFGSIIFERWKRIVSFIILLIIAAAGYGLSFNYFYKDKVLSYEKISFSTDRILQNRDKGIITVLEYTADWCPNCSLVEKLALQSDEVQNIFSRDDIEFMVADITVSNPQAESLMARLGSKSIPLLAVFPPGSGFTSPLCLRDIYSSDDVVSAVEKAAEFIKR